MIPKTGMTILDYFQLAGIKSDSSAFRPMDPSELKHDSSSFRQILATTGKNFHPLSKETDSTGLRLTDYFRTPVKAMDVTSPDATEKVRLRTVKPIKENSPPIEAEINPSADSSQSSPETDDPAVIMDRIQASKKKAAARYGLPEALIHGVIKAESNFQVNAVSRSGAQGLMQLMPATAKELGVTDAFDIDANVDGGARYLRQMLDQFGGDLKLALAAYNSGPATVKRYGGIPPYRETQTYVDRVMAYMEGAF